MKADALLCGCIPFCDTSTTDSSVGEEAPAVARSHPPSKDMAGERRQTSVPPLRPLEGRATRRLGDGSRMSGDVHVRSCGRGVRLPPAACRGAPGAPDIPRPRPLWRRSASKVPYSSGQREAGSTATPPTAPSNDWRSGPGSPRGSPHSLRHSLITAALDAGYRCGTCRKQPATPTRTTMRYDRGRGSLDRHATYIVVAFLAGPGGKRRIPRK